jgi:predicted  nucleic acid-binding Zn-ribbon protein
VEITDLHVEIADLHVEIADLHVEITDLHVEIADLHVEITDLHVEIADLHVEIVCFRAFAFVEATLAVAQDNKGNGKRRPYDFCRSSPFVTGNNPANFVNNP